MKRFLLILIAVALLLWLRTAVYAVDFAEFAYVTRFGEPVATLDGTTDAGLRFKLPWPIDAVQRIDRRLQAFDLPAVESLTRDVASKTVDKTLAVDAFVTWRIPDAAAADGAPDGWAGAAGATRTTSSATTSSVTSGRPSSTPAVPVTTT